MTLTVVAGVAAIAASVAMVAAAYDATVLQPHRAVVATELPPLPRTTAPSRPIPVTTVPVPVAGAAATLAQASLPPLPVTTAVTTPAGGSPAAALPVVMASLPPPPPVVPPQPRLRPAVPQPSRALTAAITAVAALPPAPAAQARQADTWAWWTEQQTQPQSGPDTASGPTRSDGPTKDEASAVVDTSSNSGPIPPADIGGGNDGGLSVDQILKDVDKLLGALPQQKTDTLALQTVQQPGTRPPPAAIPFAPPPAPAVIFGAPAVASRGQLLFPLPQSAVIVPASIVRVPGGEVGPRFVRATAPAVRPRLRQASPGIEG